MSVQSFIEAMPKADLHVHLEGAVTRETLLIFAEQNEVEETIKHFRTWVELLAKPDFDRLDELIRMANSWLKGPEDLTRAAYDVGLHLAKQNVRYAEVTINPAMYPDITIPLDQILVAINDGRDRAQRAWGIQMAWILAIPRDEPRKADEYARWASTTGARRGGVVGLGLIGDEKVQPVGQFERAFQAAEKKALPRVVHAGTEQGADGILKAIAALLPNRIADGWGAAGSADVRAALTEGNISLDLSMARAVRSKKVASLAAYPLKALYDDGVIVTLGSDMPTFYKMTLNDLYKAAVETGGLSVEELEEIALNAVRVSLTDDEAKQAMIDDFTNSYKALRAEHLETQAT